MNVLYLGGKTAGLVGLLTLLARGYRPDVVSYSDGVFKVAQANRLLTLSTMPDVSWPGYSLLISIHGRQIVKKDYLDTLKYGGINLHPMLSKFPGKNPIRRALDNSETHYSVGAHRMTEVIDGGEILVEKWIDLPRANELAYSEAEVYAQLYPLYSIVLCEALEKLGV